MLWVLYALLSGALFATADAFTKKAPAEINDYVVVSSRFMFGIPLLFFWLIIPIPAIGPNFWYALAALVPIETLSYTLYIKSIKNSPLSLVAPLLSFTPVFLVLTSFVMLGEFPNLTGLIGILLVVAGTYRSEEHTS